MKHAPIRSGHASPRQVQLEDCLLENLHRLPYSAISISELCRQVGVSRRAFYLYFKDKDDCLYSLIERKFRNLLLETFSTLPENATYLDSCRSFLTIFKENYTFFDLMVRNWQLDNIVACIVRYVLGGGECFLPTDKITSSQIDRDLLPCLICSQIALVLRWHNQNYEPAVDEMAQKFLKITDLVIPYE